MAVQTIRTTGADALYRRAADALSALLDRVLAGQETAVVGIPGGRSAAGVFRELRERPVDWSRVFLFMADERLVPLESSESNYRLVREELVDPLLERGVLLPENVVPFRTDRSRDDGGCALYVQELRRRGGRCDVALLSAGEDGHVASLFPGGSVASDEPFFVLVEDAPKPPPRRISMSRRLLERAHGAVLVFAGETKRAAYEAFCAAEGDVIACPARIVRGLESAYVLRSC